MESNAIFQKPPDLNGHLSRCLVVLQENVISCDDVTKCQVSFMPDFYYITFPSNVFHL